SMVEWHQQCITYILDIVDRATKLEYDGSLVTTAEYLWTEVVLLWFTALSQLVTGILRPRHASQVYHFVEAEVKRRGLRNLTGSGTEQDESDKEEGQGEDQEGGEDKQGPDDGEAFNNVLALIEKALQPYLKALQREIGKQSAIRARMEMASPTILPETPMAAFSGRERAFIEAATPTPQPRRAVIAAASEAGDDGMEVD
ncbi:hypothetical protein EV182_004859, partial [Spiromyces aspiralis]